VIGDRRRTRARRARREEPPPETPRSRLARRSATFGELEISYPAGLGPVVRQVGPPLALARERIAKELTRGIAEKSPDLPADLLDRVRKIGFVHAAAAAVPASPRLEYNPGTPDTEPVESMCPECNEPLVIYELDGVEVDHCLTCRGTWLDAGELERLTEIAGIESGRLSRALRHARSKRKGKRRCPLCRRTLELIDVAHAGDERPLELDRCPLGQGYWLHRGETLAVISRFAEAGDVEERAVARLFSKLYRSELEGNADARTEG
jgi:Zn-finger nucleic acid-binding protein